MGISSSLHHACNKLLSLGIFLSLLNCSVIKALFKKRVTEKKWLNTDLSLLTSFSKVFKKVICVRLFQHLNNNHILVDKQFGFMTRSSTEKGLWFN